MSNILCMSLIWYVDLFHLFQKRGAEHAETEHHGYEIDLTTGLEKRTPSVTLM